MSRAAELIRESRRKAGLTQAQLASAIGTTQSAVARLESKGANPRLRTLEQALRATGRELELSAPLPQVDEAGIAMALRLTPEQRLRHFSQSRENVRRLLTAARAVGG
jgi:transcriptional regulator with XRE-family HTH domain